MISFFFQILSLATNLICVSQSIHFFLTVDQNNFGNKIPVFQVIFLCQEKQSLTAWSSQQSATASCFNALGYLLILRGCLNLRILKIRLTHILYFNCRFSDSVEAPESMKFCSNSALIAEGYKN